jgi:hypothetical protein
MPDLTPLFAGMFKTIASVVESVSLTRATGAVIFLEPGKVPLISRRGMISALLPKTFDTIKFDVFEFPLTVT